MGTELCGVVIFANISLGKLFRENHSCERDDIFTGFWWVWDDEFVNSFIFSPSSLPLIIFTANESFSKIEGKRVCGRQHVLTNCKSCLSCWRKGIQYWRGFIKAHKFFFPEDHYSLYSHALTSLRPQTILFSHRNWVTIWFISLAHTGSGADLSSCQQTPGSIQLALPGGSLIGHHFFYSATTRKISISLTARDISPPGSAQSIESVFPRYLQKKLSWFSY